MLNILQLQIKVLSSKEQTLNYIEAYLKKFLHLQPDIVTLPEMFNCPYNNKSFPLYAEFEGDITYKFCQNLAKKYNIYLSTGSIPEKDAQNHLFNTAYVFDNNGNCIAKHRKMHLFDIDVKNSQHFKESDTLSAGNNITVFDTKWGKMGLCICYDFRFPELARLMVDLGAKIILVPAAFNMTTGPLHWELLFQSRAVDNQVFTIGTAPARNLNASYHSYGHSIIVSPWGKILNQADFEETALFTTINLNEINLVREQIPLLRHRRLDIYELTQK